MKTSRRTLSYVMVICAAFASAAFADECATPLPSNIAVPASSESSGIGQFLGKWGNGKWDGLLCNTLVVESISGESRASSVYSWGAYAGWGITAPGYIRVTAELRASTLHLSFPAVRTRAEYQLIDGKLHGKYFSQQGTSLVILEKIQ